MPDSNLGNQLKVNLNTGIEQPTYPNGEEKYLDWFSTYLKYQAQDNAFVEYIMTEVENGRQ